jgi:YgiT-type zinc finger domain-containing protein
MGRSDHGLPPGPSALDGLAGKEEAAMMPFEKCPVCGGELIRKDVEKLLRGGNHTAIVRVAAEVCLHCGARLYSRDDVTKFEEIRGKLERQETSEFQPLGQSFQVV